MAGGREPHFVNDNRSRQTAASVPSLVAATSNVRNLVEAVGYVRTSSAATIGRDKDSERRQRRAIEHFAKTQDTRWSIGSMIRQFSGADPIESRPGFVALLNRIEANGVRVLVEDASRFAGDLMGAS
jgi:DNA invertase Pin-like site-specific DNA recombinase